MPPGEPASINWLFNHTLFYVLQSIALAALVTYGLSHLSGWTALSRRFREGGASNSYQWPSQSIRLRIAHYNNAVHFGVDGAGLHMAVFLLFRIGHPPLFIPWSEIQVVCGTRDSSSVNTNSH